MTAHNAKLPKEDYGRALKLAEAFNVRAAARPNRRVKAVLKDAIGFVHGFAKDVATGAKIESGSAWSGPDVFLDKAAAVDIAREKSRIAYLTGDVGLTLSAQDTQKLSDIRKAFKLSSDKQAAALSLRVYDRVADGLWRGNGFSMADAAGADKPLDTAKIRSLIERRI
ncbi:MAG: hypothetical protein Q8K65_05275 [Alphaproteobacteria bacterium]|nr:hypothetical protein [Alphaproteobacteria bacterium]